MRLLSGEAVCRCRHSCSDGDSLRTTVLKVQESVGGNTTIDLANLMELPGALTIGERTTIDLNRCGRCSKLRRWALSNARHDAMAEGAAMAVQLRYEMGSIKRTLT